MSVHVESWVWKQKVGSSLRKLILVKLAQNADDNGWSSWWKQAKLAEECEASRQTVNDHLVELRGMGLLQEIVETGDGGRIGTRYRIMGPWVDADVSEKPTRARQKVSAETTRAKNGDPSSPLSPSSLPPDPLPSSPLTPLSPANLAADAARNPEYLGQRRWRVFSRPGRGPFVADLERGSCSCENRSSTPCRHLRVATEAESRAETARRRAMRDAVWDKVAEIFGAPTKRAEADRGLVVTEMAEMLANEGVEQTPERWQAEIQVRYDALARDWGVGKATLNALHRNWIVAGKLAHGVRGVGNNVSDEDDPYARGAIRADDG